MRRVGQFKILARAYEEKYDANQSNITERHRLNSAFPDDVREILEKIRATVRKAAPDAKETISYQIPTFTLHGNLVHFAAFKKHIGFYPGPSGIEKFKDELSIL